MIDINKFVANPKVKNAIRRGMYTMQANLPKILAYTSIGCFGLAIFETAKATHKSDMDILAEEKRRESSIPHYDNKELTPKEKFDLCWPNYIRPALFGVAGTVLSIAADREHNERYLALMGAYGLTQKANEERKNAERTLLPEDKVREIDDEVRQRMVGNVTIPADGIQATPGEGRKTLYVEPFSNTPFFATEDEILHAFNYINHVRHKDGVASINDLFKDLGLRTMTVASDWGWNEDQEMVEPVLTNSRLVDDEPSLPATIIDYSIEPQFNFGTDKQQWRYDVPWKE